MIPSVAKHGALFEYAIERDLLERAFEERSNAASVSALRPVIYRAGATAERTLELRAIIRDCRAHGVSDLFEDFLRERADLEWHLAQYLGTCGSISVDQASIPPIRL